MPKTFQEQKEAVVIEPMLSRSRQAFRGSRYSGLENLEINSLLIDLYRLQKNILNIESNLNNISKNLISNMSNLTEQETINDGIDYEVENVKAFLVEKSEENMVLETLHKISGKMQRIKNKIQRLEINT